MWVGSPCVAVCCTVRQVSVKHNYELTFVMKYVQTVLQAMENTRDRLNFVNNLMDMFKELVFDLHDYDAGQFSRLASVLPSSAVTALYFHHHGLVISPIVIIIVVIKVWLRMVSRSPALVLIQRINKNKRQLTCYRPLSNRSDYPVRTRRRDTNFDPTFNTPATPDYLLSVIDEQIK